MDSGFLGVYGPENQLDADNQAFVAQLEHKYRSDLYPDLQQIFTDTYFNYCYTWCPVLDRNTLSSEIARSPLLVNALALASSHIQPPLLPHDDIYSRPENDLRPSVRANPPSSIPTTTIFKNPLSLISPVIHKANIRVRSLYIGYVFVRSSAALRKYFCSPTKQSQTSSPTSCEKSLLPGYTLYLPIFDFLSIRLEPKPSIVTFTNYIFSTSPPSSSCI